jgi:hypothetical protein
MQSEWLEDDPPAPLVIDDLLAIPQADVVQLVPMELIMFLEIENA